MTINNIPYFQVYAVDFLTLTQKLSEKEIFLIFSAVSEVCLYGKTNIKIESFYAKIFYEKLLKDLEKNKKKYLSSMENGKKGGRPPKPKKPVEKTDWEEMLEFFDYTCLDCGCKMSKENRPTKDHIIPQILGGDNFITNLQPLCRQCNAKKCADHSTDFRLKFISDIPKSLKIKWFKHNPQVIDGLQIGYQNKNPNETQTKPMAKPTETETETITETESKTERKKKENPPPNSSHNISTPLYPPNKEKKGVFENLKDEGGEFTLDELVQSLTGNDIVDMLDDKAKEKVKKYAPGWNIFELADVYITGTKRGMRGGKLPRNLNTAFHVWCERYTKGKRPCR